ncbi:MAT1-2-1 like protein [Rhizophagus clarus]|uniref:MAT1-2-1 like protein n=1 Tax=Rhizophagus clarus TaxID=94130 RepID=A0A8H3QHU6_9GLOM|nr:MAT1-2-1 like protein [Rhizophagus clarus]
MNDDNKIHMQFLTRNMNNVHLNTTASSRTSNSIKGSETTSKSPAFQFISHDELLSLFEQRKGTQYFIPEGFEPVLIPRGSPLQPVANLLQNGKLLNHHQKNHQQHLKIQNQNAAAPDVVVVNKQKSTILPTLNNNQSNSTSSDVRFPQLVLARSSAPCPPRGSAAKAQKPKKPPRPPNAFILYRRSKQPDIVAQNEGISNNEVSKQVGEMWHKEPLEEKMKFQRLADAAKMEHMKKYPEYKYRPRRPHEKRRRTKRPNASLNNANKSSNNNNDKVSNANNNNNNDCGIDTSPLMNSISANDDLSFLQQPQQIERRSSIESLSSIDYFDESRRSSMISCGDINDIEYNDYLFEDVPSLVDDQLQQYPVTSSSSNSHDYNNLRVSRLHTFQ